MFYKAPLTCLSRTLKSKNSKKSNIIYVFLKPVLFKSLNIAYKITVNIISRLRSKQSYEKTGTFASLTNPKRVLERYCLVLSNTDS